jgi:hypothetical protein
MNILKGFARSLDGEITVFAVRGISGTIVQVNFPAWRYRAAKFQSDPK